MPPRASTSTSTSSDKRLELPELLVPDAAAFSSWLSSNHSTSPGVLLVITKKGATSPTSLTYPEALDEALCWGWIDCAARRRDDSTYSHRFAPRAKRSVWSERNVKLVASLEEQGRMQPAGLEAIERAKACGAWEKAYAGSAEATLQDDFMQAVQENAAALETLEKLSKQNRYAIYFQINGLKTQAARERKIVHFVDMLARGEAVHPQKGLQVYKPAKRNSGRQMEVADITAGKRKHSAELDDFQGVFRKPSRKRSVRPSSGKYDSEDTPPVPSTTVVNGLQIGLRKSTRLRPAVAATP